MEKSAAQMLHATSADAWWERRQPASVCVCACVWGRLFEERIEALQAANVNVVFLKYS